MFKIRYPTTCYNLYCFKLSIKELFMSLTPEELKHLEFIQNVITRMNTNSFQIKGWAITIISATLALYASIQDKNFILIGFLPAVIFWFLDAYYLNQERKFRGLYNDASKVSEKPNQIKPFAMRPDLYKGGKYSYWDAFRSETTLRLYLPVILLLIGMYLYILFKVAV